MKIKIDKPAIEYIKKNGGIINIDLYTAGACCVQITEPVINFGKPELLEQFDEYLIDNVTVYISRFIHFKGEELTINLRSFIGIKNLSLSGVRLL